MTQEVRFEYFHLQANVNSNLHLAEVKVQLQLGLNIGLLKLRADEDGGCVWSMRSTDEMLRRVIKTQLD